MTESGLGKFFPMVNTLGILSGVVGIKLYTRPEYCFDQECQTRLFVLENTPITAFAQRALGAILLSYSLMYILLLQNRSVEVHRVVGKFVMVLHLAALPLDIMSVFDDTQFNQRIHLLAIAVNSIFILLLTLAFKETQDMVKERPEDEEDNTIIDNFRSSMNHRANIFASAFWGIPTVLLLMFPQAIGPNGMIPYFTTASTDTNDLDSGEIMALRKVAAFCLPVLFFYYFGKDMPRLVNKIGCVQMFFLFPLYVVEYALMFDYGSWVNPTFLAMDWFCFSLLAFYFFLAVGAFDLEHEEKLGEDKSDKKTGESPKKTKSS